MSKRVLFIAPYIHDFAAFDLWLKPLGLLYVAAAARNAGYEVRAINCLDRRHPDLSTGFSPRSSDRSGTGKLPFEEIPAPDCLAGIPRKYRRYGIPPELFRRILEEESRPDAIGVGSMMTYWCGGVAETISMLRERWAGVPIILGGIYATLCPEHAREHAGADIVVEGPGEESFVDILQSEPGLSATATSRPMSFRPAYDLLDNLDSVSMLTSFGCPFSCAYCASRLLRPGFRQRPTEQVVEEITHYARAMNIRDIAFYDDALLVNSDRHIKPILRAVIKRRLPLRFHTPNGLHADMIDGEVAGLMRDSGFATIRLSLEGIDETRMKDSCMKVSTGGFEAAVSHLLTAGFGPGDIEAYVMMGAPDQWPDEIERSMRFAHEAGAVIRLADFSPIPRTPYFDAAIRAYGIDPTEPLLQNSSALPHIVPGMLDRYQALKKMAENLNSKLRAHGRKDAQNP